LALRSDQKDHLEQQVEVGLLPGGDRNHDHVAAPVFGQQAAVGKLLLDTLGLRIRLIDLVDRHDDGNFGGARVIDSFEGLRHHAVVGGHHQHDDVGDFGAAGAHAGERFVAGSIDEHNLASIFFDVISADVLGDAASLAAGYVGLANRVKQRSLAMVDVPHDGDYRSALDEILLLFGDFDLLLGFLLIGDGAGRRAEFARNLGGQLGIESLVDGGHDVAIEQLADDQTGLDIQLFGKLLDGDAFRDGDGAVDGRRTGLRLALGRWTQDFFFGFLDAIALRPSALVTGAALLFGRRRRDAGLDAAGTPRSRMHGTRADGPGRHSGAGRGTRTRPRNHRLAGA
jgi:hypothetical protein